VRLSALLLLCAAALLPAVRVSARTAPGLRYHIQVALDPLRHRLVGRERIVYTSGADTALTAIWFHAYPNALRGPHTVYGRGAECAEDYALRFMPPDQRGWMTVDSVTVDGVPASFRVDETVGRIDLPRPLEPHDSLTLTLLFADQVPRPYARFEHVGDEYTVSQWYPKIAVYDERGWVCDPYAYASEFYGDYGTFDVEITVPDRIWVGATGLLSGAEGGDNDIPLLDEETPRDSAIVTLSVALAEPLRALGGGTLRAVTDLVASRGGGEVSVPFGRDGHATLRVPRGAPVHYAYRWKGEGRRRGREHGGALAPDEAGEREEADEAGRPGPLHLLVAARDTTVADTLRALARRASPRDSVLPSLKTLRFHAERVHDFAWVGAPDYVRSDTTWSGVAVRALVFRRDQRAWRGLRRMAIRALAYASRRVGPFVWPSFTSAEAWCDYGSAMEYPMLTTNDPGVASSWVESLDMTTSHELFHSWFYGMLGSDERAHAWMDEGFTQFLEQEHIDHKYPRGILRPGRRVRWTGPLTAFDLNEISYLARAWARDEEPMSLGADSFVNYTTYGVASYAKAACMLRTLNGVIGDSLFAEFLHAYYRRGLLRHPTPQDVRRAAEEVSGRDLGSFFDDWVTTTKRAGFALGRVRREQEGGIQRATVTLRRTEQMVFPVTVEARFVDGTVQEKQVEPSARETPVVFESRARLKSASVDPRHEIVEMNRLDNGTGLLPPVRLRPLLDVPTPDAMGFLLGPTVWDGRKEGARLGLWVAGRYLPSPDFPDGIRLAEGGVSVGTRDGSVAWRAAVGRRAGGLGARGKLRAEAVRDAGLLRASLSAGNQAMALGRRHPIRTWNLALRYLDRFDLAPVDARYWSAGRSINAEGAFRLETIGPRRAEQLDVDLQRGASAFRRGGDRAPGVQYDRASLTVSQSLRLLPQGGLRVRWRASGGTAYRRVPRELLFDVAEGGRLEAIRAFYLNDRGPLRASGHYLDEGGGGVRGYAGRAVLGKRVLAGSLLLGSPRLPLAGFVDVGRVGSPGPGERAAPAPGSLSGRTLLDAGLVWEAGLLHVTTPLWLSDPSRGERPWRLRWQFTLRAPAVRF
jgi:hypothetical protein